jgi:hypothetical protein
MGTTGLVGGAGVCTGGAGCREGMVRGGVGDAVGAGGAAWPERAGAVGSVGNVTAEGVCMGGRAGSTAGVDGAE